MTAAHRISATLIAIPISPSSLILRGYHAVGITAPVNVDVIAMAAPPTTNLVHQIVGVSCGSSGAKVSSEGCSSDCDYHLEPPYPAG